MSSRQWEVGFDFMIVVVGLVRAMQWVGCIGGIDIVWRGCRGGGGIDEEAGMQKRWSFFLSVMMRKKSQ